MFHILISNDDGIHAEGIKILAEALSDIAKITVVAPDRDRSGASNSLSLSRPIRVNKLSNGYLSVQGTPTDCVHIAITGLIQEPIDMVVSGINSGANLGDDVLYSGTVAAATEGRFLGLPAIAMSLASNEPKYYDSAAKVAVNLVKHAKETKLPSDIILNVNVPDLPYDKLEDIVVTRCGHRHKAEPTIESQDPRGNTIYWIGMAGKELDAGVGTDFYAINNSQVSVTPLHVDMTAHDKLTSVKQWLGASIINNK